MARYPYLPIWVDAWIAGTSHLSRADRGTYFDLLVLMWQSPDCRVPNDDSWLAKRLRMTTEEVRVDLRPIIEEFCKSSAKWITQKRLISEHAFAQSKSEKQSERAAGKWNLDKRRENSLKRSARMAAARARGTHSDGEWQFLKKLFGVCVHCGGNEMPLERDHIMPVYQGGSDAIENIQPSCARCNAKKGPECIDKRSTILPSWINEMEGYIGRKLLKNKDGDVCLDGTHQMGAPTPTPTPTPTLTLTQESKNSSPPAADSACEIVQLEKSYHYENGVIKLNGRDFNRWVDAFPNLNLRAELEALAGWQELTPKNWFHAVAAVLAKRQREAATQIVAAKAEAEAKVNKPRVPRNPFWV